VAQFQEKFESSEAYFQMLETLLSLGQKEIARGSLGLLKNDKKGKRGWYIQYYAGDEEMRESLRDAVNNWWTSVEEETPLQMARLSRYLLGDRFISADIRRLLSESEPFHPKGKLLKAYPYATLLAMSMKLYIGGGRK
jgi:hypothetical protein